MRYLLISTLYITLCAGLQAQKMSTEDYITRYKETAIKNMQLKKVPASITLAQGILESGSGNSSLAKDANNHFGIKCHKGWDGGTYYMDDDAPNECFRKYTSALQSFEDHADFLSGRDRYKGLFDLDITDYKGWAQGLKDAGYATNPKYPSLLIDLIEKYKLYEYDKMGIDAGYVANFDDDNDGGDNGKGDESTGRGDKDNKGDKTDVATLDKKDFGHVFYINGLRVIRVKKGQKRADIERDFEVKDEKLNKINELGKGDALYEGQLIFLETKRASAEPGKNYHEVKKGESFYSIAQMYGIKTEALMKKNNMWYSTVLKPGDTLYLRKKKPMGK